MLFQCYRHGACSVIILAFKYNYRDLIEDVLLKILFYVS